ncbi:uncharacterized protein LOC110452691 [Mizuhopecten yessoensis]|uniref:uncharacterized protein LOC110452691 n=1 Tax=Mizuhopecten yessoensis TaxID=6573 RepID=UPI000B45C971|nr:uncharacterized protein LOC110452691 [Mizuhopecten yessoensis]
MASGMADRLLSSRSANTNIKYHGGFKRWESFINGQGHTALPASPIHITIYINHLLDNGASHAVVSGAVYAIKWVHGLHGCHDPTDNCFVMNLLEAAKRTARKTVCKKEPVSSEMLVDLCGHYDHSDDY